MRLTEEQHQKHETEGVMSREEPEWMTVLKGLVQAQTTDIKGTIAGQGWRIEQVEQVMYEHKKDNETRFIAIDTELVDKMETKHAAAINTIVDAFAGWSCAAARRRRYRTRTPPWEHNQREEQETGFPATPLSAVGPRPQRGRRCSRTRGFGCGRSPPRFSRCSWYRTPPSSLRQGAPALPDARTGGQRHDLQRQEGGGEVTYGDKSCPRARSRSDQA